MSNQLSTTPRRDLNTRQVELVERLLVEAGQELERVGHEQFSIRSVAQRAGVSPATAYTYLASKEHLFAELFCRLLATAAAPELTAGDPAGRLRETIRHLAAAIATSPATAAAATKSLLSYDAEVGRLRVTIGALFLDRFRAALAEQADPRVLDAVSLAFFGALLEAGMGFLSYADLGARLDPVVDVIMEGSR